MVTFESGVAPKSLDIYSQHKRIVEQKVQDAMQATKASSVKAVVYKPELKNYPISRHRVRRTDSIENVN